MVMERFSERAVATCPSSDGEIELAGELLTRRVAFRGVEALGSALRWVHPGFGLSLSQLVVSFGARRGAAVGADASSRLSPMVRR